MIRAAARRLHVSAGHLFQPVAAIFARGLEVAMKFVFQIVVARSLGSAEAGLFLLALSIASVVQCAAKFSIDRALIPSVARLRAAGEERGAFAAIVSALGMILLLALPVGILLFALADPIAQFIFGKLDLAGPLRWIAMGIVSLCLLNGIVGALTGLGAAAIGDVLRNSVWPIVCSVLLLGLTSATEAAGAATVSIIVAVIAAWLLLRRLLPARWPSRNALKLPDNLMSMAIPLWAVDTIDVILNTVPIIVLGAFGTSAEVAIFSVANRIGLIFPAVISAIGNAASPRFALLGDDKDAGRLGRMMREVALLAMASCLPIALLLLAVPRGVMSLFGPDYVQGATVLRILVAGNLVNAAFACSSDLLAMRGYGPALRRIRVVMLLACLVLSAVTIPLFGAIGAALTTATTISLSGIATGLAVRRLLRLPALPLAAGGLFARRPRRPAYPR